MRKLLIIALTFNSLAVFGVNCDLQLNIQDVPHTIRDRQLLEESLKALGYINISPDIPDASYKILVFPATIDINNIEVPSIGRHFFIRTADRFRWDSTVNAVSKKSNKKIFKRLTEGLPRCH